MIRLVVLISGSGSNLQAIIDGCAGGQINGTIAAVISNKPGVKGLERAAEHGIPAIAVDHKKYASREDFEAELNRVISDYSPDLLILAGFMRILTPSFVNQYTGKMMNIHPSLLPKYPGLNTHQRAIDAGDKEHGATVHFVTSELDGGPAIIQARVAIDPEEDAEQLAKRVLVVEHQIYPQAVAWFADKRLELSNNCVILDGQSAPQQGFSWPLHQ